MPPAGAAKSERCVSIRPEVQLPDASRRAVMARWLLPSTETFAVEFEAASTSPVPQFAGPPTELWPVSRIQFAADGEVPAAPPKVSLQTGVQVPPPPEPEPVKTLNSHRE